MYGVPVNMIERNTRSVLKILIRIWTALTEYMNSLFSNITFLERINKMNFPKMFQTVCDIEEVIYFDFETTGLNPYHDKIIEYAFLVDEDEYTYSDNDTNINSLVNPKQKFEKKITDITGIYPEELIEYDTIEKHLYRIYHFIDGEYSKSIFNVKFPDIYLVAHNCHGFDELFIRKMYKNTDYNIDNWKFIDSLLLAKKLLPNIKSYSLDSLSKHFSTEKGNHRALDDTKALKQVYHSLLEILAKEKQVSKKYLLDHPKVIVDYYRY